MSADPRAALAQFISALERHFEACSSRHGEDDPTVVAAYEDLVDAFEAYDGALYDATGEMTPFDIYGDDDEGDEIDDHDEDDGDTNHVYSGLDDIDVDDDH